MTYERTCNVDDGEWFVRAETENWAGGMFTWWTVDGRVVETHGIPVAESDPEGMWDIMRKGLPIVSDWREAVDGTSTRFRCAEDVTVRYWIENTQGQRVICGTDGEGIEALEALDRIAPCP